MNWKANKGRPKKTFQTAFPTRPEISKENQKLRTPTNWFWENSDAEFVSKVDDDCLVPNGWGVTLRSALTQHRKLGFLGTWLFYDEDAVPELIRKKTITFESGVSIMWHPFVQGSGYVVRRSLVASQGPIKPQESFTAYCTRAAYNGYTNGWILPFIRQEHMDDPRSTYYPFSTEDEFQRNRSLSKVSFGITNLEEAKQFSRALARRCQEQAPDARSYFGWRGFLNKVRNKLLPPKSFWRVKG